MYITFIFISCISLLFRMHIIFISYAYHFSYFYHM